VAEALPLTAEEEVYWQAGHRATMRERRLFATLAAAREAQWAYAEKITDACVAIRDELRFNSKGYNAAEQCADAAWHIAGVAAGRSELAALRRILPPSARGEGIVGEGSWAVFAEKVVAERDEAQVRCRTATQRIVDTLGADGPTSLEDALTRLFAVLDEARECCDCRGRKLDAAQAERDLLADALAAVSLEIAPELAALRALADAAASGDMIAVGVALDVVHAEQEKSTHGKKPVK